MKYRQDLIGNAHLDPVWFWRWQDGFHEVKATFQSALDRLDEHDVFIFTCASAAYYAWVEENAPEMFEKIVRRVREGRWVIVGGMWIQPDMNTPCGESLCRQLMYSKRYFQQKFGVDVRIGYNVDTFGHNAMTPMLLNKAGMDRYVWMRPGVHENAAIPQGAMKWRSADGSEVTAYRIFGEYFGFGELEEKIGRLEAFSEEIGQPVMCFYGVGNHGGGPTVANLKELDGYMQAHPEAPVAYGSPKDYFDEIQRYPLPLWQGELQRHASGCYSTHSASKRLNRQAENALIRAEKMAVLCQCLTGRRAEWRRFFQGWQNVMFNQFHDIMGGCCARPSLEDAVQFYGEAVTLAAREENRALQMMSWAVDTKAGMPERIRSKEDWNLWGSSGQGTPVVVFNPHPYEVTAPVRIDRPIRHACDSRGKETPVQIVRAPRTNRDDKWDGMFMATVPALGYHTYWVQMEKEPKPFERPQPSLDRLEVQNEHLALRFENGALAQILSRKNGSAVLGAPVEVRLMDLTHCDTWAHAIDRFDRLAGVFVPQSVQLMEQGPVRTRVRVTSAYGASVLKQDYLLYADRDWVELEISLFMAEPLRMLKLCFPLNTKAERSVAEIPLGQCERLADGNENHCQRWAMLRDAACGLAVINDGKYSYSATESELCITLANTSIYADHFGGEYRDDDCEYMDLGMQHLKLALAPVCGKTEFAGLGRIADLLNQPLPYVKETYHEGPLAQQYQGIQLSSLQAQLCALKRAEADDGYVMRLVETEGAPCTAHVEAPAFDRSFEVSLRAWEMQSIFLPDDKHQPVSVVLLTEKQ